MEGYTGYHACPATVRFWRRLPLAPVSLVVLLWRLSATAEIGPGPIESDFRARAVTQNSFSHPSFDQRRHASHPFLSKMFSTLVRRMASKLPKAEPHYPLRKMWPPDLKTMSNQEQLRFEKRYKRRLRHISQRPRWDKFIQLTQFFSITCRQTEAFLPSNLLR